MTTTQWQNQEEEPRTELPVIAGLDAKLTRLREVRDEIKDLGTEEKDLVEEVKALLGDGRYDGKRVGLYVTLSQGKDKESFSKDKFKEQLTSLRFECRHCKKELGIPAGETAKAEAIATSTKPGNRPLIVARIEESD